MYNLFSRIYYPEVADMFERLDKMFEEIVENIGMEQPQELNEENILDKILEQVDDWDHIIARNPVCEEYFILARRIYSVIHRLYYESPENRNRESDNDVYTHMLDTLGHWFDIPRPLHSFAMLLYYHQRIKQLGYLLELYQKAADKKTLSSRHLFEKGLSLLQVKEEDYLDDVYGFDEQLWFRKFGRISFLTLLNGLFGKKTRIAWVKEKTKRDALIDRLNQHLKFAALAYRGHKAKVKGIVTDVLEPYEVHFAKYGGANIKGRFHLQGNMNGYVGYCSDKTIVIGFSGTEPLSCNNWKTNIRQFFGKLDPVYLQAAGLAHAVWMGKRHKEGFQNSNVIVCGHSLGGGLMQYAVSLCNKSDMVGYGYNSAGLSRANMYRVRNYRHDNIFHLHQQVDLVFVLPCTYQLGKSVNSNTKVYGPIRAHLIDIMRKNAGKYRHDFAILK